MSNFLFILPWAIANILAEEVFYDQGDLSLYILGVTLIEVVLINFRIYPKIKLLIFNEYINSMVFYIFVNLVSNIIMFLWVFSDLSV